ncbi:MAG: HAMP domain-containing protein [Candidatus Staskawiczbacteria bacterium]|nr:HAMP domain-containing protein [Candidatus Staskawiczbacteria bacterium]
MAKQTTKTAISMILVGIFVIFAFIATTYEQLQPSSYVILLLLFIFMFFFGIAMGQRYTSPIKKILNNATELSKGNLSSRIYLESKDELSELANTFNKIAEELQVSREQEANVEKNVAVKVRAKTQELEETIKALEQKVRNRTIELEKLMKESSQLQETIKTKGAEIIPPKKV